MQLNSNEDLSLYLLDISVNSFKANANNIYLSISKFDNQYKMSVKDDGIGLDENKLAKILKFDNVGHGLNRLNDLVNRNNGTLKINTKKDLGFEINITLDSKNIMLGNIKDSLFTIYSYDSKANVVFDYKDENIKVSISSMDLKDCKSFKDLKDKINDLVSL